MQAAVETRDARPAMTVRRKLAAYLALTKPRVIELLLVVTAPTMILAQQGLPSLWLLIATLIGGAMSAGSAGAFNCYIDRDIDRVMKRTQGRPLVTGELSDREALVFAYGLGFAFVAYYPALALLGRTDPVGLPGWVGWIAPAVALPALAVAGLVWRVGVRNYRSTGS